MVYSVSIEIQASFQKVTQRFLDLDQQKNWQENLLSHETVEGVRGMAGSVNKLRYQMGKRIIDMRETILSINPETTMSATYEAKGVLNQVDNRFIAVHDALTEWHVTNEFYCKGMAQIMAIFTPWLFKKETLRYMNLFKEFVEKNP